MASPLPPADLDHVRLHTEGLWEELRGARIFITGGTGFFGHWLLETFDFMNRHLRLGAEAVVLSRAPGRFLEQAPHLKQSRFIRFHAGDVTGFSFPDGRFTHLIHAATPADARLNAENPQLMLDTITRGAERTLEFALKARVGKLLHTSSGAVYGPQPPGVSHLEEERPFALETQDSPSAYAAGKRLAEHAFAQFSQATGTEVKTARCFAFVGPRLPLDGSYAIGNFLRDGLAGRPIQVAGDGTPYRSYLHAADLSIWLWTILLKGASQQAYNVGSPEAFTIAQIAEKVGRYFGTGHAIAKKAVPGQAAPRYVPSVRLAEKELGLVPRIGFEDALDRTVRWYRGA